MLVARALREAKIPCGETPANWETTLSSAAHQSHDEGDEEYHQEDIEQNLGDACRRACYPAKPEDGRDDRDYQKCNCPT